jgi:hypothetical protein
MIKATSIVITVYYYFLKGWKLPPRENNMNDELIAVNYYEVLKIL